MESLSNVVTEIQSLRLQYENLIQICETLIRPCPTIECISTTPANTIPVDNNSSSSTFSTVCSEIDKILESARRLSISNPAKQPVKPCRLVKPPSHTAAKINQACITTTKTRFKQTESIYKSSIQQSVKHVKTGPSTMKQATPPNLVTKAKSFNNDTNRVPMRRVPMRVPILIETISQQSLPIKYRKLTKTITELVDHLNQTKSHDYQPLIKRLCPTEEANYKWIKTCLLISELQLLYKTVDLLTEKDILITEHSSVLDIVTIKYKCNILLAKIENILSLNVTSTDDDWLPWRLHHSKTTISMQDHISFLSLKTRSIFLDACTNTLLPWLRQTDPSDARYPLLIHTIQILTGLNRTTFITTTDYTTNQQQQQQQQQQQ